MHNNRHTPCARLVNDDLVQGGKRRRPPPKPEPPVARCGNIDKAESPNVGCCGKIEKAEPPEARCSSKASSKVEVCQSEPEDLKQLAEENELETASKLNCQFPVKATISESKQKSSSKTCVNRSVSAKTFVEGCSCRSCLEEKKQRELKLQHHNDCECKKCMEKRKKSANNHHKTCQCATCMEMEDLRKKPEPTKSTSFGKFQKPPPLPARDFSNTDLALGSAPMSKCRPKSEVRSELKPELKSEPKLEFRCSNTESNINDDELERIIERKIHEIIKPLLKSLMKNEKVGRSRPAEQCWPETEMLACQFKPKGNPCSTWQLENSSSSVLTPSYRKYCEKPKRKQCLLPSPPKACPESCFDIIPQKYHSEPSCTSLCCKKRSEKYECPLATSINFDDIMSCKSCTSDDDDY